MSIFKRKEKIPLDKASRMIMTLGVAITQQSTTGKLDLEIDRDHFLAVNYGYILGMSLIFLSPQLGLKKSDDFINSATTNAQSILVDSMSHIIPDIQKYANNTKNFVLVESQNVEKTDIFDELTKRYLNDLLYGEEYNNQIFNAAKNDILQYYGYLDKVTTGTKIK